MKISLKSLFPYLEIVDDDTLMYCGLVYPGSDVGSFVTHLVPGREYFGSLYAPKGIKSRFLSSFLLKNKNDSVDVTILTFGSPKHNCSAAEVAAFLFKVYEKISNRNRS